MTEDQARDVYLHPEKYILGMDPFSESNTESSHVIVFQKNGGNFINVGRGPSYMNEAGLIEFDKAIKRLAAEMNVNIVIDCTDDTGTT